MKSKQGGQNQGAAKVPARSVPTCAADEFWFVKATTARGSRSLSPYDRSTTINFLPTSVLPPRMGWADLPPTLPMEAHPCPS